MNSVKHLAFIPARKGSKGLKNKNLILFDKTANFLKKLSLFDEIHVSTNEKRLLKKIKKNRFNLHLRKNKFSGDRISIKKTLQNFIKEKKINKNFFIWLFYLPILYKNKKDFVFAMNLLKKKKINSICSFIKSKSHPFHSWKIKKNKKISQFIKNDVFRRQDLPTSYNHYHYVCAFRVKEISKLNSELINPHTFPLILNNKTQSKLVEIDTSNDLKKYKGIT